MDQTWSNLQNLHCRFDWHYIGQIYGGDFEKFCSLLRIYELYTPLQHALVNYVGFSHSIILFSVPLILVSTGSLLNWDVIKTTEIINIENSSATCQNLEEYPLPIGRAVGFNMGSLPVICGGYDGSYSNQCHRMESGKWQPFANLAQGYVLY